VLGAARRLLRGRAGELPLSLLLLLLVLVVLLLLLLLLVVVVVVVLLLLLLLLLLLFLLPVLLLLRLLTEVALEQVDELGNYLLKSIHPKALVGKVRKQRGVLEKVDIRSLSVL